MELSSWMKIVASFQSHLTKAGRQINHLYQSWRHACKAWQYLKRLPDHAELERLFLEFIE